MSKRYLPFGLILLLFLVACSSSIEFDLVPTATFGKSEKSDQDTPPPSAPKVPTDEDDNPTLAPEPVENLASGANAHECDDPFEGENVRFSTQYWTTNFCLHSIPYAEIFSGGPPPDGIPPIDSPKFESIASADNWLDDREPVIIFQESGDVRAYPLQILMWHEIVNDTVGSRPVVVTFCPLCNTALVFERPTLAGELLTFGTSGNLRNSDLVMYDRQTESWWQQFSGEAIVGDLIGTQLTFLPAAIISWADFKIQNPDGQVLSVDTGFNRSYGSNPYVGYDDINQSPFLYAGELDDRLLPMERVLGVLLPDGNGSAYTFARLSEEQVINDTLGETPIVVFWKAGTASALDSSSIASGNDIGSTGVFLSTLDGQTLTFISNGDGIFQDEQTGSSWIHSGLAVDGSLQGSRLDALPHHDTFWFAWAAFVPDGKLSAE